MKMSTMTNAKELKNAKERLWTGRMRLTDLKLIRRSTNLKYRNTVNKGRGIKLCSTKLEIRSIG